MDSVQWNAVCLFIVYCPLQENYCCCFINSLTKPSWALSTAKLGFVGTYLQQNTYGKE